MNAAAAILSLDTGAVTRRIAGALKQAFGDSGSAAKKLADTVDAGPRAAENWLAGRNAPDAVHLLRLMATVPELQAEVRRLVGMEANLDPELERALAATVRTFQRFQEASRAVRDADAPVGRVAGETEHRRDGDLAGTRGAVGSGGEI